MPRPVCPKSHALPGASYTAHAPARCYSWMRRLLLCPPARTPGELPCTLPLTYCPVTAASPGPSPTLPSPLCHSQLLNPSSQPDQPPRLPSPVPASEPQSRPGQPAQPSTQSLDAGSQNTPTPAPAPRLLCGASSQGFRLLVCRAGIVKMSEYLQVSWEHYAMMMKAKHSTQVQAPTRPQILSPLLGEGREGGPTSLITEAENSSGPSSTQSRGL